jgi:pimeloyl-ACP methyl ester carboxylesterase
LGVLASLLLAASAAAQGTPTFTPGPCPKTPLPDVQKVLAGARCGSLAVPENRSNATSATIALAVAIVPARSPTPAPDPIVHMTGGPGGVDILEAPALVKAGFNQDRDLILMDQRGTKYSQPALTCPNVDRFYGANVGTPLDSPVTRRGSVAAVARCRRALAARGIDLAAYNTTENAADFADLRVALGIPQWDVYGVSYGSDLALTYMRQHPEGVRSVTLDSVVPPSAVTLPGLWPNAGKGFGAFFAAHPGFERSFTRQVRRLEAHPVIGEGTSAVDAKPTKVALDGGALVNWLVAQSLAQTPVAYRQAPGKLRALAAGKPDAIASDRLASYVLTPDFVGYGLVFGAICSEWVPAAPTSQIAVVGRQTFPAYPRTVQAQAPQFFYMPDQCRAWNVPPGPAAQRDVTTSTIPTLTMSGGYDAVTAVPWARLAAQTISPSTSIVIPRTGHEVIVQSACAQRVLQSFLATPLAPDAACAPAASP